LLEELLSRIRDALDADTSALLMLDRERQELVAARAKGLEEEVERGTRFRSGRGSPARSPHARHRHHRDVDHSYVLNPILSEKGVKSLLGAPLSSATTCSALSTSGTLTPRDVHRRRRRALRVVRSARARSRSTARSRTRRSCG
jgi:hypothetical protein